MTCCRFGWALAIMVLLATRGTAADPPPLLTAQGTVEKADAATLTVKPRMPDGKFGKNIVLKITGTTKVTTLMPRMQKGAVVITQKDTDVKDLQPKQSIAIVYTMVKDSPVLLAAVVQPPAEK
jgi:hypothetical protein